MSKIKKATHEKERENLELNNKLESAKTEQELKEKNLSLKMTRSDMEEHLEQYYEAAGFSNYYEKVLKNATDEEIEKMFKAIETQDDN